MNWDEAFKIIFAALGSVGAGGVLVFGLSSWLGKVWANRILEKEKSEFAQELEKTKRELDIYKETIISTRNDKLKTYRASFDVVAKILSTLDAIKSGRLSKEEALKIWDLFNERRLQLYAYLGMLAPQNVMDAQDALIDHIMDIASNEVPYDWKQVRIHGINFINEIRKDIGIDSSPIEYKGNR